MEDNFYHIPLAERVRPRTLEHYIGQKHLVGPNQVLRKMIESNVVKSMILWGPPGTGKTTLAMMMADLLNYQFFSLSAISSGVKEVREVIQKAQGAIKHTILFIDEIHRFSKSQQDALLGAVERGHIVLIGATTENPSFEVNAALLSRCQVYVLESLSKDESIQLINEVIKNDLYLKSKNIVIVEYDALISFGGGDARKLLNTIELVIQNIGGKNIEITNEVVSEVVQKKIATYDKNGEFHYDIISAFIKSIRGSDPDAALYWLARMIVAGEDVAFIARRLIILAAEDIGLANPTALIMAQSGYESVKMIGFPESRIILSQIVVYLATSPKSNSVYTAIDGAINFVKQTGDLPVPLHLRNAPTKLMKELNYGKNYKYPHAFEGNFVVQQYLPDGVVEKFYTPSENSKENEILAKQTKKWKK